MSDFTIPWYRLVNNLYSLPYPCAALDSRKNTAEAQVTTFEVMSKQGHSFYGN